MTPEETKLRDIEHLVDQAHIELRNALTWPFTQQKIREIRRLNEERIALKQQTKLSHENNH